MDTRRWPLCAVVASRQVPAAFGAASFGSQCLAILVAVASPASRSRCVRVLSRPAFQPLQRDRFGHVHVQLDEGPHIQPHQLLDQPLEIDIRRLCDLAIPAAARLQALRY